MKNIGKIILEVEKEAKRRFGNYSVNFSKDLLPHGHTETYGKDCSMFLLFIHFELFRIADERGVKVEHVKYNT